jgi:hypothetical protein
MYVIAGLALGVAIEANLETHNNVTMVIGKLGF